jgi:hypothetical protein
MKQAAPDLLSLVSSGHGVLAAVYLARSIIRKKSGKEYGYWGWIARWPTCKFRGGLGWSLDQLGDDVRLRSLCWRGNWKSLVHDDIMKLKRQELED